MLKAVIYSDDSKYSYKLIRTWDKSLCSCTFICLNPSTLVPETDRHTLNRCISYAEDWGFGGITLLNLFAYRAASPKKLLKAKDPIGPENNKYLLQHSEDFAVAAWGNYGRHMNRGDQVKLLFKNLHHLGLTKQGQPRHPIRLNREAEPIKWK